MERSSVGYEFVRVAVAPFSVVTLHIVFHYRAGVASETRLTGRTLRGSLGNRHALIKGNVCII